MSKEAVLGTFKPWQWVETLVSGGPDVLSSFSKPILSSKCISKAGRAWSNPALCRARDQILSGLDAVYGSSIQFQTLPLSVCICLFMELATLFRYHVLISWMTICNKGKHAVVQCSLNSTFVGKIPVTLLSSFFLRKSNGFRNKDVWHSRWLNI